MLLLSAGRVEIIYFHFAKQYNKTGSEVQISHKTYVRQKKNQNVTKSKRKQNKSKSATDGDKVHGE